ncbi:MAG: cellulase family glycosylhydrolase [Eubacterium sp.]|nr:cellulase family glycosylhydrolase [Eubacterium sp.]
MKRIFKKAVAGAVSASFLLSGLSALPAVAKGIDVPEGYVTAYEKYGDVMVATDTDSGYQQLCDENGEAVQLRGMSTFGLQWGDGNWVLNDDAFDALAYDWHCDIIRLAMYVTETGYADNPADCLERVEKGIELATERGMYVLIDWHMLSPGDPTSPKYLEAGVDLPQYAEIKAAHPDYTGPQLFFAYLSQKYGDKGNVLFETANEPNGNGGEDNAGETWTNKLLPYHQSIVDVIREYDADENPNIVICGTDNWSQFVDAPLVKPVTDPAVEDGLAENNQIMYTFHFYAGTHDTKPDEEKGEYWLGSKIQNALDGGIAVFCTEWGTSEATGDGGPYINYAERWLDFLAEKKISWCSWSLALKNEISAAMQGSASKNPTDLDADGIPNWSYATDDTNTDLSITGNYVRAKIRGEEAPIYSAYEKVLDFSDVNAIKTFKINGDSPNQDITASNAEIGGRNYLKLENIDNTGIWGNRFEFDDLGTVYGIYTDITFDVVVANEDIDKPVTIKPVIQSEATSYWDGAILEEVTTTPEGYTDMGNGYSKCQLTVSIIPDITSPKDNFGHLLLLTSAGCTFYLDNISLKSEANGDISTQPKIPDEPGTFVSFPFEFESGQREGWKPEGASTIDYTKIAIEEVEKDNHAMSFPVKLEAGKNEWEDGVRLTSPHGILSYEECLEVTDFSMDIYLEKDKATTGNIAIAVCSIPNGDGYWYQSGEAMIDPVNGGEAVTAPGGRELLKYTITLPVNAAEPGVYPFSDKVAIRNIILALHNEDSDYEGRVYYDNIGYIGNETPEVWPFSDLDENSTLAPEVLYAYQKGIISGFSQPDENGQVTVKPNKDVTRAQFAIMLYKMAGSPEITADEIAKSNFSDVKEGVTGYKEVVWANANGIISGFSNNTFKPNNNITRSQIAIMLKRFGDYQNYQGKYVSGGTPIDSFSDYSQVSSGAVDYLQWAVDNGILAGVGTKIKPNGNASRSQSAAFCTRFFKSFVTE